MHSCTIHHMGSYTIPVEVLALLVSVSNSRGRISTCRGRTYYLGNLTTCSYLVSTKYQVFSVNSDQSRAEKATVRSSTPRGSGIYTSTQDRTDKFCNMFVVRAQRAPLISTRMCVARYTTTANIDHSLRSDADVDHRSARHSAR